MTDAAPPPGLTSTMPVLTLGCPADIVAAVPYLLGFTPSHSVVLMSLRGVRLQVGLTLRADLPAPEDLPDVVAHLAGHLVRNGASAAIAVVYAAQAPVSNGLWPVLRAALETRDVAVQEALRVADGRWWSYLCDEPACCPPEGTVILQPTEPGGPNRVGAALVHAGMAALGSREELEASVQAAEPDSLAALAAVLAPAAREAARQVRKPGGLPACRRVWQRRVVRVLEERGQPQQPPPPLPDRKVAELLIALADVPTRDIAAGWVTGRGGHAADAVTALWLELTRRAPPPYDVAPATLLGLAAWYAGNGALARVAVERALATDPSYRLATLLERLLDEGVDPALARRVSRGRRVP